jgi:hypothetical protein
MNHSIFKHSMSYHKAGANLPEIIQPSGSWDDFFASAYPNKAVYPITLIRLYEFDGVNCLSKSYSGEFVSIGNDSPWAITAISDYGIGYLKRFCVKAYNGQ